MKLSMRRLVTTFVFAAVVGGVSVGVAGAAVTTTYINLGSGGNALLRTPSPLGASPRDHIGIFVMHPSSSYINNRICRELADRGYHTLCSDNRYSFNGDGYKSYEDHAGIISAGIRCLKGPSNVDNCPASSAGNPITKVVIIGHSMAWPDDVFLPEHRRKQGGGLPES